MEESRGPRRGRIDKYARTQWMKHYGENAKDYKKKREE
jgi:hypothetical protein